MIYFLAYVAAMFCIALPLALFAKNEVAAAVFVVWGVGQVAYQLGAPEPGTQVVIYGVAFAYVWTRMVVEPSHWSGRCVASGVLFAPLMIVSMGWMMGNIDELRAWLAIYWIAMTQIMMLTHPFLWARRGYCWAAARRRDWRDHFSMSGPCPV